MNTGPTGLTEVFARLATTGVREATAAASGMLRGGAGVVLRTRAA